MRLARVEAARSFHPDPGGAHPRQPEAEGDLALQRRLRQGVRPETGKTRTEDRRAEQVERNPHHHRKLKKQTCNNQKLVRIILRKVIFTFLIAFPVK